MVEPWLVAFVMAAREGLPLRLVNRKPDESYSNKTQPRAKDGLSLQRRDAAQAAITLVEA